MLVDDKNPDCPCGSALAFKQCCSPYISGIATPPTAEALMRSRYTAFSIGAVDYLIDTLAPERRSPHEARMLAQELRSTQWIRLEILDTKSGKASNQTGEVEFKAYFEVDGDRTGCLHERSNFRKENGRWVYVDGEVEIIE